MNCSCLQPPRELIDGYAVCACTHLVHQRTQIAPTPFVPFTPTSFMSQATNHWAAVHDPDLRRRLVQRAKNYIGPQRQVPRRDVVDATSAARAIGENVLANDIEYEQWVLSL